MAGTSKSQNLKISKSEINQKPSVLLLTLRVFSATGGIEKVCKVAGKTLTDISEEKGIDFSVFSMYDRTADVDEKYIPRQSFKGFELNKLQFVVQSVINGCKKEIVILSHINLLVVGFFIKIFSPNTKVLLYAHGIEVWDKLPSWKKILLNRIDTILAVSCYTRDKMIALNGMKKEQFKVLNNCIDPYLQKSNQKIKSDLLLQRYGFSNDNKILLTLTRLSEKERLKGYDKVLRAVKKLAEKDTYIRYLFVGKYEKEEKERLDHLIKELGITNLVRFAGFVPDEDIESYFNLADMYVMPSKKEGFGIIFIEALYYGLPVIAGNKDGSVDALANGSFGLLVNPDNQEEITSAIEKVIANKASFIPDQNLFMEKFGFPAYKRNLEEILFT